MVAVGRDEHLRLVAQAAEGDRMDDAVAFALKIVARAAHDAAGFGMAAAAAVFRAAGAVRDHADPPCGVAIGKWQREALTEGRTASVADTPPLASRTVPLPLAS